MNTDLLHPRFHAEGEEHVEMSDIAIFGDKSTNSASNKHDLTDLEAKVAAMGLQIDDLYLRKLAIEDADEENIRH